MGKMTTYIMLISGTLLIFYFMGLLPPEAATSGLLSLILNPSNIFNTAWYSTSLTFLAILGGLSITSIIGKNFLGNPELVFLAPVTIFLLGLGLDILLVANKLYSTMQIFAVLLVGPLIILYVLTCIEWFRGRD